MDFVEFSRHGHTKELANSISRSKIPFDRQAGALAEIDEIGSLFTILDVVVCRNDEELPERFVRGRPEGALRFLRDGRGPLDETVDPRVERERSFAQSARFALSYRGDDEGDKTPDAMVMGLLDRASAALRKADAAGGSLEEARLAVVRAAAAQDGWKQDEATNVKRPEREKKKLPVLPDLDRAPAAE